MAWPQGGRWCAGMLQRGAVPPAGGRAAGVSRCCQRGVRHAARIPASSPAMVDDVTMVDG
jgi:hypothetical protein